MFFFSFFFLFSGWRADLQINRPINIISSKRIYMHGLCNSRFLKVHNSKTSTNLTCCVFDVMAHKVAEMSWYTNRVLGCLDGVATAETTAILQNNGSRLASMLTSSRVCRQSSHTWISWEPCYQPKTTAEHPSLRIKRWLKQMDDKG